MAIDSADGEARVRHEGDAWHIAGPSGGAGDLALQVPHRAALSLRIASGDVRLDDLASDISMQVMSGDVTATALHGSFSVRIFSGDVNLLACQLSRLAVDSMSGDTIVETTLVQGGDYDVRSLSGALRLCLAQEQGCTLRARLLSGDFSCSLPHKLETEAWGRVVALINGGGVAFGVRSTSGDVSVTALPADRDPAEQQGVRDRRASRPLDVDATAQPKGLGEEPPVAEEAPSEADQRMEVLRAIEQGALSVDEGLARLKAFG